MKQVFIKPALTLREQIQRLASRGMVFADTNSVEEQLRHVNYYRFAAYWLPFEADHRSHIFRAGTSFDEVIRLYELDRQLRLIVLDAIERVEVSLRSVWAHSLAIEYGPHAHLNPTIVKSETRWREFLSLILREIGRSNEVFVKHLLDKYIEVAPPIWATCEVMSLGALSKWYENIKSKRVKSCISSAYELDQAVLESWCRHLTYVRNLCAHHGRLWNREFTITPAIPRTKPSSLVGSMRAEIRGIYNSLVILKYLMDLIQSNNEWSSRLLEHLLGSEIYLSEMGFPADWKTHRIWTS